MSNGKLNNIRIVMIETSHPGNIGAAARAMKNMCLSDLHLVNPEDYPSPVATARAAGADDVLSNAVVCSDFVEAVSDCQLVVGASARLRSVEWPQITPRQLPDLVAKVENNARVAIVFGREDSGLTNEEMDRCHFLLHIPTNAEFSSLNVASAIQVVSYELYQASLNSQSAVAAVSDAEPLASVRELEGFFQHMESTLTEIGFLKPPSCNKLLRRLRRMFNRAQLDQTDINILRGILSAAEGRKYDWQKRKSS